jgi:hypothetical protein
MSGARWRVLLGIAVAIAAAAALALTLHSRRTDSIAPRPLRERPTLLLLTSLQLVFGEDFSLQGGGSPALEALQTRYDVVPISVTDKAELRKGRLLLMAQPLAQPAEDLVALDAWVRGGGRVLLLADPMLEWPSLHPLGDPLRPPPMFMDSGLLAHWGLQLDAPNERGIKTHTLDGYEILAASPGSLRGSCAIGADRLIAHCRVGKGAVTVIADADLLNVEQLGAGAKHNLEALLTELARLERS